MECTGTYSPNKTEGACVRYPYCSHYGGAFYLTWDERRRQGLPERKSGGPRDPSQRRIAKYNYKCQRPDEYLESWQVDLPVNPRHARWARRRRKERYSQ